MRIKRTATACTFIGALIGAGFASGREISLFFARTSIFTPILSGIILGFLCYFFLRMGAITKGKINLFLSGKGGFSDAAVRLCNAVTYCAMAAGSEEVLYSLFSFRGGGIITGLLTILVVAKGIERVKFSNFVIVPIIVLIVAVIFFKSPSEVPSGKPSVFPAVSYAAMNIIDSGYLVAELSSDFSEKDCAITASICGIVLSTLLVMVFMVIQNNLSAAMPLMETATSLDLRVPGSLVMYLAIFTTMTGNLAIFSKGDIRLSLLLASAAFAVGIFGFKQIVDKTYPVLGIAGCALTAVYLYGYFRYAKTRRFFAFGNSKHAASKPKV